MVKKYPYERFIAFRRYYSFDFLRDSDWVAYICDASGQFNIWKQRSYVGDDAYYAYQLTNFIDDVVRELYTSKVDDTIVFFADKKGDENYQVYQMDVNGWPEPITQKPKVRHIPGTECISPNGRFLAFSSNERSPFDMDLIIYDRKSEEQITLTKGGYFLAGVWSKDSRNLLANELYRLDAFRTLLIDVDTGESKYITPPEEKTRYMPFAIAPDKSSIYFLSDKNRDFMGIMTYDLKSGTFNWLITLNWDVELAALSNDGERLAYVTNENGYSTLRVRSVKTGEEVYIDIPKGVIFRIRFSHDDKKLGMLLATPKRPAEIYVLDLEKMILNRLVKAHIGNIPEEDMVEPELIEYDSFDGLKIPAFLWKPKEIEGKKLPAIISIHGGPMAQERPYYSSVYQYLTNHGFVIMAPNFRGSTGYGKSYEKLIYRDWGGGDLKDYEYAVKWLLEKGYVDKERVGVYGGSYGGFATLSCITRLPDYWKAAVDICGPSNLLTFIKTAPKEWSRYMEEWIGDPEKDEQLLKERSPINYIENVKADLLVIQGANDPRVVKAESDQMVERLRNAGKYVEYYVFEDEGHGISKYSNLVKMGKMIVEFFERRLGECKE
jgi:dipeptidyl aminopeptidase/acylaminoacyl peptidase